MEPTSSGSRHVMAVPVNDSCSRVFPLALLHVDAVVEGFSNQLQQPIAFAAVDSIVRDEQGQLRFHYVVVEVCFRAWSG
jgi:hypothetical protein